MKDKRTAPQPENPWLYILLGILVSGFGTAAYFDQEAYDAPLWLGPFLLGVAAIFALIGVISLGVSIGVERAECRVSRPRSVRGTGSCCDPA